MSHNNIGELQRSTGSPAEALVSLSQSREIVERLARENPSITRFQSDLAKRHLNIGNVQSVSGHPVDALASYEQAHAILGRLARENPSVAQFQSDLAMSHFGIGEMQRGNGHPVEALAALQQAHAIWVRLARENPESPDFASCLGTTLNSMAMVDVGNRQFEEARAKLTRAIEWQRNALAANPKKPVYRQALSTSLTNLIQAAESLGRSDEVAETRRGLVELCRSVTSDEPGSAQAHATLGNILRKSGRMDEAIAAAKEAVRLNPDFTWGHQTLAWSYLGNGDWDNAIASYGRAIQLTPNDPTTHFELGEALRGAGRYDEAVTEFRRAETLAAPASADAGNAAREATDSARRRDLLKRLPDVLSGRDLVREPTDRIDLAYVCADRKVYVASARLFSEAFEADARLADDRQAQHPYNAACAAALAAAGKGNDERKPDDAAKVKLRKQALGWLKAELAAWAKLVASVPPQAMAVIAQTLKHWQEDTDLAGIRDDKAIEALPESERAAWRTLWADVEALRRRAEAKVTPAGTK